jgi:hypothetical protein
MRDPPPPGTFVCQPYEMLLPVVLQMDNQARALKTFMACHDTFNHSSQFLQR